jgi:2-keto-4-pentenoate hydratase/2-oxohepta-3-ene-1,7-dioic acid hydratase in catechol pathway
MRFVTYASPSGDDRVGLVDGSIVHGFDPGTTMIDLLERGDLLRQGGSLNPSESLELESVQLRSPLQPRSIRDCAGFLEHLRKVSSAVDMPVDERHTRFPPFYFTNPAARFGPADDVPMAPGSAMFDYELEVAAVIGRTGADIPVAEAEAHIAGYTVFCDWSARDLQIVEMPLRLGPSKGKDTANTLGPMIVTPDELEAHRSGKSFDLEMSAFVNDVQTSHGNWRSIDWGFDDMISYASRGTTLRPGDVIGSGTVETGCLFESFVVEPDEFRGWLAVGDTVRLAVQGLGELRHRIVASPAIERLSSGY